MIQQLILDQIGNWDDVQKYKCRTFEFSEQESTLSIVVYHHRGTLLWYLIFSGVHYIQCPFMHWIGANFIDAPHDIAIDVWRRVYPNLSDEQTEHITHQLSVCMIHQPLQPILIAYENIRIDASMGLRK